MKRIVFIVVLFVGTIANAQKGKITFIEAHGNLLSGTFKDTHGTNLGISGKYYFDLGEGFKAGPSIGVDYSEGKKGNKDLIFMPVAASIYYGSVGASGIGFGTDIGYNVGLSPSGNQGGFHVKPFVHYSLFHAGYTYTSLDNGVEFTAIQLGILFIF